MQTVTSPVTHLVSMRDASLQPDSQKPASAKPAAAADMRISLAIALIVTVIAEMVAGNSGIGFYILSAQRSFQVPEMYAGVIALALLGFALNKGFIAIESWALNWHESWNAASA